MTSRLLLLLSLSLPQYLIHGMTSERNAGIYFRLNQKAVDYIAELSSEAMPQILNNMHIPDITVSPATISKIHIDRVERPTIQAKFMRDRGVKANVSLPFLRTSADCSVDSFFTLEGSFAVELHNFTIDLELNIRRNETSGGNIIEVPHCETTHSDVVILLDEDSMLAMIQGMLQSSISSAVKEQICETILEAVKFVDAQEIKRTDDSVFNAAEFGASLCEIEKLDEAPQPAIVSPADGEDSTSGFWDVNLDLVYPPRFTDEDVVFGIDGGLLFNGTSAASVEHPPALDTSVLNTKMTGILIADSVPNSFFAHIFNSNLGKLYDRINPGDLPKSIKKIASMMCSRCFLEITGNLRGQPHVEISATRGARVELAGDVLVQFQGREDMHSLINASTKLHITLKPTVRHSRVYGDIILTNVDVKLYKLAVGGIFAKPIEKLVSFIVPKVLWPQVKKRIRFAVNKRGIQLPVLCGVELDKLSLSYIDRAIVINTDFMFDLPLFVRKFKLYLNNKSMSVLGIPSYVTR